MKGKKFLAVLMSALIISTTTVCTTSLSASAVVSDCEKSNELIDEYDHAHLYKDGEDTFVYTIHQYNF